MNQKKFFSRIYNFFPVISQCDWHWSKRINISLCDLKFNNGINWYVIMESIAWGKMNWLHGPNKQHYSNMPDHRSVNSMDCLEVGSSMFASQGKVTWRNLYCYIVECVNIAIMPDCRCRDHQTLSQEKRVHHKEEQDHGDSYYWALFHIPMELSRGWSRDPDRNYYWQNK